MAAELRAIARDDERADRDERRLLNRLRADLIATFPAALKIAGDDMGAPTFLRLLERWPTANALAEALETSSWRFARAGHHGWPDRFADRVQTALAAKHSWPGTSWCGPRPTPSGSPRPSCWPSARNAGSGRRRMGELLLGAPRSAGPSQGQRPGAGGPWRRDLPELSRASVTVSPPGWPVKSATTSSSSIPRTPLHATPGRPRSPDDPARANSSSPAGWPATATCETPFNSGRSAALRGSGWAREFYDRPTGPRQESPRRATRPGQPLARSPLALPTTRTALRRSRPRHQPQPRPPPSRSMTN